MTKRLMLFALSLAFSAIVFAQSQQAVRDHLFGATDALIKAADAVNAKVLAPDSYASAMKLYSEAGDKLAKGNDLTAVREDLTQANALLQKATDAAKLAKIVFASTLNARAAAEKAEAAKYVAKDWGRAEESLGEAAAQLEEGNLNKASKSAQDVTADYKEAEAKAINAKTKAAH